MNSADKVKDAGDGKLLGMEKTILTTMVGGEPGNRNWLQVHAEWNGANNPNDPLENQMGTGQLNAFRAFTQFEFGEWDSLGTANVPVIGWDYGLTLGAGDRNKYVFDEKLEKDSYVSITLTWDRKVSLNDNPGGTLGEYDALESFTDGGLTDMDLYLLPKGALDISQASWSSKSSLYSVEHLFFMIPATAEYEFWVVQGNAPHGEQTYAVAWWAKAAPGGDEDPALAARRAISNPEPSTWALLASGLVAFAAYHRKRLLRIL